MTDQSADCVALNRSHVWMVGRSICVVCGAEFDSSYLDQWLAALNRAEHSDGEVRADG